MAIILDGTNGETFPTWTTATRPTTVTAGLTGYNTTLAGLETYNGTTWVTTSYNIPAPSTAGNLLTSNGTTWTSSTPTSNVTQIVTTLSAATSPQTLTVPSTAKVVIVSFDSLVNSITTSAGSISLKLINASGSSTNGTYVVAGGSVSSTSGLGTTYTLTLGDAANYRPSSGTFTFTLINPSTNMWSVQGTVGAGTGGGGGGGYGVGTFAGSQALSTTFSGFTLSAGGSGTITGTITISYM